MSAARRHAHVLYVSAESLSSRKFSTVNSLYTCGAEFTLYFTGALKAGAVRDVSVTSTFTVKCLNVDLNLSNISKITLL